MKYCWRCGLIGDNIDIYIVAPKTVEHLCLKCSKKLKKVQNGNVFNRNRLPTVAP